MAKIYIKNSNRVVEGYGTAEEVAEIWRWQVDPLGLMPWLMVATLILLSPALLFTLFLALMLFPLKALATFLNETLYLMLTNHTIVSFDENDSTAEKPPNE
jgi:hypothetical protein